MFKVMIVNHGTAHTITEIKLVCIYTLLVESNMTGKKIHKKGSITLLR